MSSFSYWSRDEPIAPVTTDHWSKLKAKTFALIELPTGNVLPACVPAEHDGWKHEKHRRHHSAPPTGNQGKMPTGTMKTVTFSQPTHQGQRREEYVSPYAQTCSQSFVAPVGCSGSSQSLRATTGSRLFQDWVQRELSSPLPPVDSLPAVQRHRRMSAPGRRSTAHDSEFNRRAKEGFKYWYREKTKPPTLGAKYTMGTSGSVLGVGKSGGF